MENIFDQLLPKHPDSTIGMFTASLEATDFEQWKRDCELCDKLMMN